MPNTLGIDVASSRAHAYAVVDEHGVVLRCGAVTHGDAQAEVRRLLTDFEIAAVGVDAPRMLLTAPRRIRWARTGWAAWTKGRGHGRHCEIVVRTVKLALPQWTPMRSPPRWMANGIDLFRWLKPTGVPVYEVFPTASVTLLDHLDEHLPLTFRASSFAKTAMAGVSKSDLVDAAVGALTVREVVMGRGCEVGGGDGFGTIALPRPLPATPPELHKWPPPPRKVRGRKP